MSREPMAEHKPELESILHRRIDAQGGITFADFMETALYHPEYGYYSAHRDRIGKQGDFFTSSSVHPLFGKLLGRQLRQMWELMGQGEFTVAEQGGGEGHLALDILDALAEEAPEFYARLRYRMVELSPDNRRRQRELLARHLEAGKVEWCGLEQLQGFSGCFLSNELVDAFPVHLVEMRSGELKEVFVVNGEEGFAEELRAPSTPRLEEHLGWVGATVAEGNRAEVNLAAPRWMQEVGRRLERGFVLTVDYGYPAAELYSPQRSRGTLMCYRRHQSNEEPLSSVGCQDITAHVDFTALERAGEASGLSPLYFGEQYRFLMGLGFLEELLALQARESDPRKAQALRLTLKTLILPEGGMGETFKVLVQGKEVGNPELLCRRRISEIPVPPDILG